MGMTNGTLIKRGKTWHWKYRQDGRVRWESFGGVSKREAEILRQERISAYHQGYHDSHREDCDILASEFWTRYSEWSVEHKTRRTRETDALCWRHFVNSLHPEKLGDVKSSDVEVFKRYLKRKRGQANRTVNDTLARIQSMYNWAIRNGGQSGSNPFSGFTKLPTTTKPPRFMTQGEISTFMSEAAAHSANIHLFCALCVYAGMRLSEASHSRWEWIDFDGRTITIQADTEGGFIPKGKRHRTIPLNRRLAEILVPHQCNEGFILKSERKSEAKHRYHYDPKRAFRTVSTKAGLAWVTPHVLRHTFASRLVQEGVDLYRVQTWLGHQSPKTTMIYAHLRPHDGQIDLI